MIPADAILAIFSIALFIALVNTKYKLDEIRPTREKFDQEINREKLLLKEELEEEKKRLQRLLREEISIIDRERQVSQIAQKEALEASAKAQQEAEIIKQSFAESHQGFPTILNLLSEIEAIRDIETEKNLRRKKRPAYKAAEIIREETSKRREAEKERRRMQLLLEYYASIFPAIAMDQEDKDEHLDLLEISPADDKEDMVRRLIPFEEYQKLSPQERNQRALDIFWNRSKSKHLIGKLYEQYIGFLYESKGYDVNYYGIQEGLSDLGRDLICTKGNKVVLIQCKNWSQSKTIYEKHIFQFFGTLFQMRQATRNMNVKGAFYTATTLSDTAKNFANEFKIDLYENFRLERYPIIKCNIGNTGEKIYHLPFDQQYDATKISKSKGEFYCMTVAEAEEAGFRRAYKWKGMEADHRP